MNNTEIVNKKRLNRKSYILNMIFTLPVFITATALGNAYGEQSDEFLQGFSAIARITALILVVPISVWTARRLHDLGKSGLFTLLLLPPFTIFLLAYTLFASNEAENKWGAPNRHMSFFGIKTRGVVGVIASVLIGIFMMYLTGLYLTFLLA